MSAAADAVDLLLEACESDRRAILAQVPPASLGALMAEIRRQSDALDEMPNASGVMPWRESDRERAEAQPRNPAALGVVPADRASAGTAD